MDLELCTRDIGCKNWPTRELAGAGSTLQILFLRFLICEVLTDPISKLPAQASKRVYWTIGLSVCAEWILSFVQEILGVRTGPQGSWIHPAISLPEFS